MDYNAQQRFNSAQDDYLRAPEGDNGDLCYFCHNEADGSLEFDYCLACSDCYHAQSLKALEDSNQPTTRLMFEREGDVTYIVMRFHHDSARASELCKRIGANTEDFYDDEETVTSFEVYTDEWHDDAIALWIDDLLNN